MNKNRICTTDKLLKTWATISLVYLILQAVIPSVDETLMDNFLGGYDVDVFGLNYV